MEKLILNDNPEKIKCSMCNTENLKLSMFTIEHGNDFFCRECIANIFAKPRGKTKI